MKRALLALWAVFVVASPVAAYQMHANANAPRVAATWQQPVVTVNDPAVARAAAGWSAPFVVRYAPAGADITVAYVDLSAKRAQGDAAPVVDGDRIVSCHIRIDPTWASHSLAAHELGHCLGLVGHSEPGALMAAFNDQADVTDADRAALARLYR